ncbi:hypothetical protein pb186bvf_010565 [Paramecium bursaria]
MDEKGTREQKKIKIKNIQYLSKKKKKSPSKGVEPLTFSLKG